MNVDVNVTNTPFEVSVDVTTTPYVVNVKNGRYVPPGGTTNQVLGKLSDDDYNVDWIDQSGGGYNEAVLRENNTVLFDLDYIIGNSAARTGNILFDFTNAKLGAVTVMIHNDGTIPTFPAESIIIRGSYVVSVNNYIYFNLIKKSATQQVLITISQEVL